MQIMIYYARAYNQSVAEDYYAAMQRVEQRLSVLPAEPEPDEAPAEEEKQDEIVKVPTVKIMTWMELLSLPELDREERLEIAEGLRQALGAPAPPG